MDVGSSTCTVVLIVLPKRLHCQGISSLELCVGVAELATIQSVTSHSSTTAPVSSTCLQIPPDRRLRWHVFICHN